MSGKWTLGVVGVGVLLATATLVSGAGLISSVTDSGGDTTGLSNFPFAPVFSQRENDAAGTLVPFGEDVFAYTDRSHQFNGPAFDATTGLLSTSGTNIMGLPAYLVGGEYVSTRNSNRDNADFRLYVTVSRNATAYLLVDNRLNNASTSGKTNTTPPDLGSGGTGRMPWVADDGWTIVNTGISPNGQVDFVALDEGGSITDFTARSNPNSNLGVGPGVKLNQFFSIFKKDFQAGETIVLKEQNGGGLGMYSLVVTPEPATMSLLALAAVGLISRRRR